MTAKPELMTTPVDPDGPTALEFRRAMGSFASGVTVITGSEGEEPVGFACQSFASVSLEPPLVLFCADHKGRAWPRMREFGRFCANVLGERQSDLCARFGSSKGSKYEGLAWERSRWGTPALPDVLLRVHAEVGDVHVCGDHDIVIGRVLEVEAVTEQRPMIFFRGGFGVDRHEPPRPDEHDLWVWGDHWG